MLLRVLADSQPQLRCLDYYKDTLLVNTTINPICPWVFHSDHAQGGVHVGPPPA